MINLNNPLPTCAARRIVPLTIEDSQRLKVLLELCSDFSMLINGSPPGERDAEELLMDLPPGKSMDDKLVLGIETNGGELAGVIDLVKDYPEAGNLFIGLMLLAPSARGNGTGGVVLSDLEGWARKAGADKLGLGVLAHNLKGHHFWVQQGFQELQRKPPRLFGCLEGVVIVMEKNL